MYYFVTALGKLFTHTHVRDVPLSPSSIIQQWLNCWAGKGNISRWCGLYGIPWHT